MVNPTQLTGYYIGIMSGTSMDAIDAVLVEFHETQSITTCANHSSAFPDKIKHTLQSIIAPDWRGSLKQIAELNAELGDLYAQTAQSLIKKSGIPNDKILAIGNHGQTVWHQPKQAPCFSWQLGDANRIAEVTGVTTIADFRNRDIAAGGEGAPLVPAFHESVFANPNKVRVIVNIGGISNISMLTPDEDTFGFDTGPGNGLMDAWCQRHQGKPYDHNGEWSSTGQCQKTLLSELLQEPYFSRPHPKSTGKEFFNLDWLQPYLSADMTAADVQATLLELTAISIQRSIQAVTHSVDEVFICGGGAKNVALFRRLKQLLAPASVNKTDALGIDADWVEAIAFAWLARQTLNGLPGNLASTTGAKGPRVLGAIYQP